MIGARGCFELSPYAVELKMLSRRYRDVRGTHGHLDNANKLIYNDHRDTQKFCLV